MCLREWDCLICKRDSCHPLHLLWQMWHRKCQGCDTEVVFFGVEHHFQSSYSCSLSLLGGASCEDQTQDLGSHLHWVDCDTSILVGAMVISWDSLCPPFTSAPNCNIFQSHFDVEFLANNKKYMCQISPFQYTSCYRFMDSLLYRLFAPWELVCPQHRHSGYDITLGPWFTSWLPLPNP